MGQSQCFGCFGKFMIPTLIVILVYIVGPLAILTWAVKRFRHGVKPTASELAVVAGAVALMVLFALTSTWNVSDRDTEEVNAIVGALVQDYDFPVKARFQDRPAVEGVARPRRLEIRIYGVIDRGEQDRVMALVRKLRRQLASKTVVVSFLREEAWEESPDGSRQRRRDLEELLRTVRVE